MCVLIYRSLACTIVEMLTGSPPWRDLEPMAAMFKIATELPKYTLPPNISTKMVEFLQLLFSIIPEKRPTAKDALKHSLLQ